MKNIKSKEKTNEVKLNPQADVMKLFVAELKTIFWVEKQLFKTITKMEKGAVTKYLKASLKGHFIATQEHVQRLESIFRLLNEKVSTKKCNVMKDILTEVSNILKATEKNTLLRDLCLITIVRKIENYEIEKYGALIWSAKVLGEYEVAGLLEKTLVEEKEADETFIAVEEDTLNDTMFKIPEDEDIANDVTEEELEAAEE